MNAPSVIQEHVDALIACIYHGRLTPLKYMTDYAIGRIAFSFNQRQTTFLKYAPNLSKYYSISLFNLQKCVWITLYFIITDIYR